jgi:hypothetical protein
VLGETHLSRDRRRTNFLCRNACLMRLPNAKFIVEQRIDCEPLPYSAYALFRLISFSNALSCFELLSTLSYYDHV